MSGVRSNFLSFGELWMCEWLLAVWGVGDQGWGTHVRCRLLSVLIMQHGHFSRH
jgi:hypothetical protein